MTSLESTGHDTRHAPLAERDDWRLASMDELDESADLERAPAPQERLAALLARAWTDAGLEAHAAIGSYARFALQLMSLAAPPSMINGCAQAMQDEVAHAQACFSLARRYAGRDVGPGPLPIAGRGEDVDLTAVVLATVQRGCIGEAVSALSSREALEHCQDAATREVLIRRQEAKAQQAQLAWRFVAWALRGAARELPDHVRITFLTALTQKSEPPALEERDRLLLRYGVLSDGRHAALEQRILREVVLPCMEALLARGASPKPST